MAPAGLSAVLRSRRKYTPASQGKLSSAALRGTCFYPWRSPTTCMYKFVQPSLRKVKGKGKYANTKTPKRLNGKKTSDKNYNLSSQLSNPKGVECE